MNDHRLDLRGLNCPEPVLRAARALRGMAVGERIALECTDPLAAVDVPHFARSAGHEILSTERAGDVTVFVLRKGR